MADLLPPARGRLITLTRRLILTCLVTGLLSGCGCMLARSMIFPGNPETKIPANGCSFVHSLTSDGEKAGGFLCRHSKQTDDLKTALLVVLHGNGEAVGHWGFLEKRLGGYALDILYIEYPGYGISRQYGTGAENTLQHVRSLVSQVQNSPRYSVERTTFLGRSLGSGVAMAMLSEKRGGRAVLISPYTSLVDVGNHTTFFPLANLLVWDDFPSIEYAESVTAPVWIIHGKEDRLIPWSMGEELHRALPGSKLTSIPKAEHNDIFRYMARLWPQIAAFALSVEKPAEPQDSQP